MCRSKSRCILELKIIALSITVAVLLLLLPPGIVAVGSPGLRTLAIQVPDINLKPGVAVYLPIELKTVDVDYGVEDDGLVAMSKVPGVSIVTAYATPVQTVLPNNWAPIGQAEGFFGGQPWYGSFSGVEGVRIQKFAIIFDGSAPENTQGEILIGVKEGGDISPIARIIGAINVYVRSSPQPTWFTVTSAVSTVVGNRLILKHPYLDDNINANVFVTHVITSPGNMHWNHPISVAYDATRSRWTIMNDDDADMPKGLTFNIRIDPGATVVRSPNWKFRNNLCEPVPIDSIPINHSAANNNPYATIIVTPRSVDSKPIAVRYIAPTWYIVHADNKTPMPPCGVYNVQVMGFTEYFYFASLIAGWLDPFVSNGAGLSVQGANTSGPRDLPFWWQLGNPNEVIIVTQNLSPPHPAVSAVTNPKFLGLSYSTGTMPHWQIADENGSSVPSNSCFNVWGTPQLTP